MANHTNRSMHYRLGDLDTRRNQRPLICVETDKTVAYIASDAGPALVGTMTTAQARRKFPDAFTD
jgi:hypothetical protein